MIRRLLVGLVLGALLGAIAAAALIKGLGVLSFGLLLALASAAVTGAVVGLVAGKPIWASGAKIEAGLKAGAGAVLGIIAMFLVRKFLGESIDLTNFGAGAGTIGDLPATSLPIVAAVLGGFFEVDNTPEAKDDKATAGGKKRVDAKVRVADEESDELEETAPSKR
ncbi:MAG: hypothetical protein ACREJX_05360, partial [Polyangiaceae bacterium]